MHQFNPGSFECLVFFTYFRCDFSGNAAVGDALADMLKLGASKPWQDALEAFTGRNVTCIFYSKAHCNKDDVIYVHLGEREMSARPILEYFDPLYTWLKQKNQENGDAPGWQ